MYSYGRSGRLASEIMYPHWKHYAHKHNSRPVQMENKGTRKMSCSNCHHFSPDDDLWITGYCNKFDEEVYAEDAECDAYFDEIDDADPLEEMEDE